MKVITKISRWLSVIGSLILRVLRALLSIIRKCGKSKSITVTFTYDENGVADELYDGTSYHQRYGLTKLSKNKERRIRHGKENTSGKKRN